MQNDNDSASGGLSRGTAVFDNEANATTRATIFPPQDATDQLNRLAGIGLMSAGIAHDFGNLIQIIGSGVREMEMNFGRSCPPELPFLSNEIMRVTSRAAALTRRILDHSRGGSGELTFVDISAVVLQMRTLIGWAAGHDVKVCFDICSTSSRIYCALAELESAIINLVINARHAMPTGGTLTFSVCDKGNDVVLRVVDTGCGMSDAVARHACDPFFTSRPRAGGSGLGLAIVCTFIRSQGGTIAVDSVPGRGTAIELTFRGPEPSV